MTIKPSSVLKKDSQHPLDGFTSPSELPPDPIGHIARILGITRYEARRWLTEYVDVQKRISLIGRDTVSERFVHTTTIRDDGTHFRDRRKLSVANPKRRLVRTNDPIEKILATPGQREALLRTNQIRAMKKIEDSPLCKGCGVPVDEKMPGCPICRARHAYRARAKVKRSHHTP